MRRTHWTIASATLTAVALGLIGCATTQASPESWEELPLQTGSAEVTQTPPEWSSPPSDVPNGPSSEPSTDPSPVKAGAPTVDFQQAVRQSVKNATAAAVIVDRDNDTELLSQNADRQFFAGSLVKLLVGVDALERSAGNSAIRRQVVTMIRVSDDQICSELWVSGGGGQAIISRMRQRIGLKATEPPRTPGQWGDTLITAHDLVRIYDYILDKAPSTVRMAMLDAMAGAAEYGSDSFYQYFGIPSVIEDGWAIKQAWTDNSRAVSVHSTGLVNAGRSGGWRYTVILLTEYPRPQTYDFATKALTMAARNIPPLLSR